MIESTIGQMRTEGINAKYWRLCAYALFFITFCFIIGTFLDYGVTYDEHWNLTKGTYIIRWYTSGFQDDSSITFWNFRDYGGLFVVITVLFTYISPLDAYETSHMVNALLGLIGLVYVYKLGAMIKGPKSGFLSALFLLITPRFYGHIFHNFFDIPFAVFFLISVYYLLRLLRLLPKPPRHVIAKLGVAVGATFGIRIGAILLVGYIGMTFFLWLLHTYFTEMRQTERPARTLRTAILRLSGIFVTIGIIAYPFMLIWWPAAQVDFLRPLKSLWYAMNFEYVMPVFFDGHMFNSDQLPWYYLPKWFLITLPEFYVVALIIGLGLVLKSLIERKGEVLYFLSGTRLSLVVVVFAAMLPILVTIATAPPNYDSVRHFLFVVPFFAVLAAVSISSLIDLNQNKPVVLILISVIVGISLTATIIDMVQLHPYQYVYFNRLFGKGLSAASQQYETDYWGSSFKEGVAWLQANYDAEDMTEPVKVGSCGHSVSTSHFLTDPAFTFVGSVHSGQQLSEEPDLFLATTRWECHETFPGEILHTVSRQGTPLLYIIQVAQSDQ